MKSKDKTQVFRRTCDLLDYKDKRFGVFEDLQNIIGYFDSVEVICATINHMTDAVDNLEGDLEYVASKFEKINKARKLLIEALNVLDPNVIDSFNE